MGKERLQKMKHDTTPHPYLSGTHHPYKTPSTGEGPSFCPRRKIDFQNRGDWNDVIPTASETSVNPFQSTNEEIDSSWEDMLSDDFPFSSEEKDSSAEIIHLDTEFAEHSSPEVMRLEGSNFSVEIISPIKYPRKTTEVLELESELSFSPKFVSSQVEYSFENSRTFDLPVHESRELRDSSESEKSLASTITALDICNFDEGGKEISFITTINSEDIVDTVFKHPGEPNSPKFDEAFNTAGGSEEQHTPVRNETRTLNGTLNNTPPTGREGREKISPRQLFIHSKLSSGELDSSIIRQSSRKKRGKQKRGRIRLFAPDPPKAIDCSGTRNEDPYAFRSEESDFEAEISLPSNKGSSVADKLIARKKTPGVKSRRGRKKKGPSKYTASCVPLSKEEVQEYTEYMKTVPLCPLRLQNSPVLSSDLSTQ